MAHMPLAPTRVALWEARDYPRDVVHGRIKATSAPLEDELLEHHLRRMGLLPAKSTVPRPTGL